jgi:hypothetical protein
MEKLDLENVTLEFIKSLRPDSQLNQKAGAYWVSWELNRGPEHPDSTLACLEAAKLILDGEIGKLLY